MLGAWGQGREECPQTVVNWGPRAASGGPAGGEEGWAPTGAGPAASGSADVLLGHRSLRRVPEQVT